MPKKRVVVKPQSLTCPKLKASSPLPKQTVSYEFRNELADLKVECANKSKTIQEYERIMEELQEKNRSLEAEMKEEHASKSQTIEEYEKLVEKLKEEQKCLEADHKVEVANKSQTILEYEKLLEELKNEKVALEVKLDEFNDQQIEFNKRHNDDLERVAQLQQEKEKMEGQIVELEAKVAEFSQKYDDILLDAELQRKEDIENLETLKVLMNGLREENERMQRDDEKTRQLKDEKMELLTEMITSRDKTINLKDEEV